MSPLSHTTTFAHRSSFHGLSGSTLPGLHLRASERPGVGPVLEAVLSGRRDPEFWQLVSERLRDEIPRRSPRYLVFDVRALECIVGSRFVGGLVAGAVEMNRLGRIEGTRIVATGDVARRLTRVLRLCNLESVFGAVHPDLESALADADS
jgi:hypothetical protein